MEIPPRPAPDEMIRAERRALLRAVTAKSLREADREVVLVDAQIGCPISGANRKTFGLSEPYRL